MISKVLFNTFSDVLSACTSAVATVNLKNIYVAYLCPKDVLGSFNGNIPHLKALKVNFRPA